MLTRQLLTRLSDKMAEDAVYVADVGQNQIWSCGYVKVKRGKFLTSGGMGTMGLFHSGSHRRKDCGTGQAGYCGLR